MIGIVIVAHGGLAGEYLSAVEHVVGKQTGMLAIPIEPDHNRDRKQAEICAAADSVDTGDGVVVVTDMFGGTPSNLSISVMETGRIEILAGMNLPMLIKFANLREQLELHQAAGRIAEQDATIAQCQERLPFVLGVERVFPVTHQLGLVAP